MKKQGIDAMSTCSVKLWYNKQRIKKSGNVSLYLQIIVKRDSVEIPLRIEWPVRSIDHKAKELLPRHSEDPDFLSFKTLIEQERSKYWKAVKRFLLREVDFSLTDVIREARVIWIGQGIVKYMKEKGKERVRKKEIKENSYNTHKCSANWVEAYTNGDFDMCGIDSEWLENYQKWLLERMDEGGTWCRIKDVKSYLTIARKKDKIPVDRDYENFSNPKPESDPVWLEQEELILLMQFYNDPQRSPYDKGVVKAFLFACFTGLRISDLKRWNQDWIQGNEMVFEPTKKRITDKRKNILRIPIIPIAKAFIDNTDASTFELPADTKFNKRLKNIASQAGITKNLTTHVARHTFGTQLALSGVPVLVISKLMGHKKVETTMIYIHIAEQAKARAMMKLQEVFGNYGFAPMKNSLQEAQAV